MYFINFLFIEDTDNCEEAERSHDWLKNNFEPWEEVLHHWEKSFLLRKKLIHDHTTYPNLCSLFDNWNILTSSQGYILVNNLRYICMRAVYIYIYVCGVYAYSLTAKSQLKKMKSN